MRLPAPLSLRRVDAESAPFLFELYGSTRGDLPAGGAADDALSKLLRHQFEMREAQYRQRYPNAADDLILLGEERVGRLSVDASGDEIVLIDISFLPAVRNRGLGTTVLQNLVDEAEAQKRAIRLSVARENPATGLYDRFGFEILADDGVYQTRVRVPG